MSGPLALLLSVLVVGFFFHHLVVHAHFAHVWTCLLFVHARTSVHLSTSHKFPIRLRPQELCLLLIFIRFLSLLRRRRSLRPLLAVVLLLLLLSLALPNPSLSLFSPSTSTSSSSTSSSSTSEAVSYGVAAPRLRRVGTARAPQISHGGSMTSSFHATTWHHKTRSISRNAWTNHAEHSTGGRQSAYSTLGSTGTTGGWQ